MDRVSMLRVLLLLYAPAAVNTAEAQVAKKTIWQGVIHLGDNPEQYPKITSAGMAFQVPFKAAADKALKLTVTAADIQTVAGHGHYVEVIAHFEDQPGKAAAKEVVVETFRIKDDSAADKAYAFEVNPGKGLKGAVPAYYSVRIKVDTFVSFSLWDDFLVKRIEIEQ